MDPPTKRPDPDESENPSAAEAQEPAAKRQHTEPAADDGAKAPAAEGAPAGADGAQAEGGEAGGEPAGALPFLDKIIAAIRQLKSHSGSSAKAIMNVLSKNYGTGPDDTDRIKATLKAAAQQGILTQVKFSYLVTADPRYEDTTERVRIEEKEIGDIGGEVRKGDEVTISYKGTLAENGHVFDEGSGFRFTVGAGDVIKGMDHGVMGMRVGGRRIVHIPSSLGYGKRGAKPDIPPNAALVFDITLDALLED